MIGCATSGLRLALRQRVLSAVNKLNYAPSNFARGLKRRRNQLIALVVSDLSNPFFARIVRAAEAAAWDYSLVVFNSDEKPEAEKRILQRVRRLSCDGLVLVPSRVSTKRKPESGPCQTVSLRKWVHDLGVFCEHCATEIDFCLLFRWGRVHARHEDRGFDSR